MLLQMLRDGLAPIASASVVIDSESDSTNYSSVLSALTDRVKRYGAAPYNAFFNSPIDTTSRGMPDFDNDNLGAYIRMSSGKYFLSKTILVSWIRN